MHINVCDLMFIYGLFWIRNEVSIEIIYNSIKEECNWEITKSIDEM